MELALGQGDGVVFAELELTVGCVCVGPNLRWREALRLLDLYLVGDDRFTPNQLGDDVHHHHGDLQTDGCPDGYSPPPILRDLEQQTRDRDPRETYSDRADHEVGEQKVA